MVSLDMSIPLTLSSAERVKRVGVVCAVRLAQFEKLTFSEVSKMTIVTIVNFGTVAMLAVAWSYVVLLHPLQ